MSRSPLVNPRLAHVARRVPRYLNFARLRAEALTPRRALNALKVEAAYRLRRPVVPGLPYEILVDLMNICPLRCPLCYTGRRDKGRPPTRMEADLFRKIIDELAPTGFHLFMHNWGEPLLHKEIIPFIEYAKRAGLGVTASTSFSFPVSPEFMADLVRSGLDTLVLSIDGATEETYRKYRIGGDFGRVMENARAFLETRRRLGRRRPIVEWQYLRTRHSEHEADEARSLARSLGVDQMTVGEVLLPFGHESRGEAEEWFPSDQLEGRRSYCVREVDLGDACWWLWRTAVINSDGGVAPCCLPYDVRTDFGNVRETSFGEIWNGPAFVAARSRSAGRRAAGPQVVCDRCPVVTLRNDKTRQI